MYQNIFCSQRTDSSPSIVYVWDDEHGLLTFDAKEFHYAYRPNEDGQYTALDGKKLKKIKNYKWEDTGLYESDVPKPTRVLTDLYLDSDAASSGHRVLTYDIETDSTDGFPTPELADKEITAIANHDSVTDHYTVFLLDKEGQLENSTNENETVISCRDEVTLLTEWLDYYTKMAPTIISGWNIDSYDIPYTFNRLKRVLGYQSAHSLSPIGIVQYNEHREQYQIAGVSCLDYIKLYKKYIPQQKPSYRLDAIAKDEVGMGKIEYEGTLDMLFKTDIKKFLEYNLLDVKLVVAIDKKKRFIELARMICHMGHVQYEDFGYSSKFIEGTILTYLHRKGIIAPNKPEGGREAFATKMAGSDADFIGAFVKTPMPGLYEWVYSLDLTSLYPSIIMSLNISPETKRGKVLNWNLDEYMVKKLSSLTVEIDGDVTRMSPDEFSQYIEGNRYAVSSNGVLYDNKSIGIIPEILDSWFKQRKEYKALMFKYEKEGNKELAEYYDQMQSVQKIFLNSIYGVLGLSIFRFYDLDNAAAVTSTGQDVIKTTAKFVNSIYKKKNVEPKHEVVIDAYWDILKSEARKKKVEAPPRPNPNDHCVYIDTDSVYFSATELLALEPSDTDPKEFTIQFAKSMESKINGLYDVMAKRLFNCDTHRFSIKGEAVMKTALWVAKKRYALKKVYDLESDHDVDKLTVKGLDVVRSSYPPAFQKFMKEILNAFLDKTAKSTVDNMIINFIDTLRKKSYLEIAKNTAVKNIEMFDDSKDSNFRSFPKGVAAHVRASITYNRFLRMLELDKKHTPIRNGDKIKWVYLKNNPYGLETIAIKTYDDPQEVIDLINEYIDYDMLFEKELSNKLQDFYDAVNWGGIPTDDTTAAFQFFSFAD